MAPVQESSIHSRVDRTIASVQNIMLVCDPERHKRPGFEGLSEAFPKVLGQMGLTESVFNQLETRLKTPSIRRGAFGPGVKDPSDEMQQLVDQCSMKAAKLEAIFGFVIRGDPGSREARYRQVSSAKESVEELMKDLLELMLKIAESPLRVIDRHEQESLMHALADMKAVPASLVDDSGADGSYIISNTGAGLQAVHAGQGSQQIYSHHMGDNSSTMASVLGQIQFWAETNLFPSKPQPPAPGR
ncbi:hypothetical protein BD289DRAFT_239649 [Coniella lustricola]|uniref:NACHT-NTPase and P-loop NTPases N-terminal domain-containing protein n=1 Tax=Coniella lustricola TaxID=2025994 RepID=A0A2T3ALJ6_9PEZI|nr:hypothetical protein BD289DRAFT_239649 [Coniella lustricola]